MEKLVPLFKSAASDSIEGDKLLRSVVILVCGMLLFNLPTLLYKVRMLFRGVLYFFFCWDKSFKKPIDPGTIFGPLLNQGRTIEKKTIYFVRHGESTWNDTFNKGKHRSAAAFIIGFVPGLIKAVLYEIYLLLSGKLDRCVHVRVQQQLTFVVWQCVFVDHQQQTEDRNGTDTVRLVDFLALLLLQLVL